MDVYLTADNSDEPRAYTLQVQQRGSALGVMLQGQSGRYMLSDAVAGIDLAQDEFIARVRHPFRRRAPTGSRLPRCADVRRAGELVSEPAGGSQLRTGARSDCARVAAQPTDARAVLRDCAVRAQRVLPRR